MRLHAMSVHAALRDPPTHTRDVPLVAVGGESLFLVKKERNALQNDKVGLDVREQASSVVQWAGAGFRLGTRQAARTTRRLSYPQGPLPSFYPAQPKVPIL